MGLSQGPSSGGGASCPSSADAHLGGFREAAGGRQLGRLNRKTVPAQGQTLVGSGDSFLGGVWGCFLIAGPTPEVKVWAGPAASRLAGRGERCLPLAVSGGPRLLSS